MDNKDFQYALPYPGPNTYNQTPPVPPINPNLNKPPIYQNPYEKPLTLNEESYIENIIRLNRCKLATFYMTYSDSNEWRDRVYKGVIEASGVDHIIISDPRDGKRYILLNIYLDWVEFNEEINYDYPLK